MHIFPNYKQGLTFVYLINIKLLLSLFNCMLGSPRSTCNSRLSVQPSNISTQDDNVGNNNRWTEQLKKSIESLIKKNQIKYSAIARERPQFPRKKQKITLSQIWSNPTKMNQQFLLKQLDSLIQEQSMLDEELEKMNLLNLESEELKKIQTKQSMDHYAFLRSIWKRNNDILSNEERIDKLNKKVGLIKDQISSFISQQKQVSNRYQFSQAILVSKKQQELQKKYEQLVKTLEQKEKNNYLNGAGQITTKLKERQKLISELQQQNKLLNTKLSLEKEKSNKYEKQLISLKKKFSTGLQYKGQQLVNNTKQKKYIFTSVIDNFTLTLSSSLIKEQKSFKIQKTLVEVQLLLAKLRKNQDRRESIKNKSIIDRPKQSRLSHQKGRQENQKKPEDSRAKTAFKSSPRPYSKKYDYREESRKSPIKSVKPKEKLFKI